MNKIFSLQKGKVTIMKKRGFFSWLFEFAGRKKAYFGGSVILAILGVAASFVPYLLMANIVEQLIAGNREWKTETGESTDHDQSIPGG